MRRLAVRARDHVSMLQLSVRYVRPDQVDRLRDWFRQIETTRRDEAVATLVDETVSHETAILLTEGDRPILVYAMEVDDPERARRSAGSGRHPVDRDHQAVMQAAIAGRPDQEVLLDITP